MAQRAPQCSSAGEPFAAVEIVIICQVLHVDDILTKHQILNFTGRGNKFLVDSKSQGGTRSPQSDGEPRKKMSSKNLGRGRGPARDIETQGLAHGQRLCWLLHELCSSPLPNVLILQDNSPGFSLRRANESIIASFNPKTTEDNVNVLRFLRATARDLYDRNTFEESVLGCINENLQILAKSRVCLSQLDEIFLFVFAQ